MAANLQPRKLREATQVFRHGGLIAYPTEAVYGLGCDPLNGHAVERLLRIKARPLEKGVILIAADFSQLLPFIGKLPDKLLEPVLHSWPGPYTWIFPAAKNLPRWLTGAQDTLAVRVTNHPLCIALCRSCASPLVSTSANPGGSRPARSALAVRRYFKDELDCILHGDLGGQSRPTRIRNALDGQVLRA